MRKALGTFSAAWKTAHRSSRLRIGRSSSSEEGVVIERARISKTAAARLPAAPAAVELAVGLVKGNGRVHGAERGGERVGVLFGRAGAAADHARPGDAQIERSLHPVVGLGRRIVEA